MKVHNECRLEFFSRSSNESFARLTAAAFAAQLDPTLEELEDIKTAVSEAVTNCIVHAYPEEMGRIRMRLRVLEGGVLEILKMNNLTTDDIQWVVPHEANIRIIEAVAKRAELPLDKVVINIDRYGNTSAATIPLALWDHEPNLRKGDNLIFTAFGAGFVHGASYYKWAYDGDK